MATDSRRYRENDHERRMDMDHAGTMVILPPGTPLIVNIDKAAEMFSVSATTLRKLYAMYDDFPAGKLSENNSPLLFDVMRCYEWFARYLGTDAGDDVTPTPRRSAYG